MLAVVVVRERLAEDIAAVCVSNIAESLFGAECDSFPYLLFGHGQVGEFLADKSQTGEACDVGQSSVVQYVCQNLLW